MKLTEIAVDRPITTSMIVSIVIVISTVSLSRLPIDLMPDVSLPNLSVSVSYPGATPEEIETLVTRPIEEAMGSVQNVEEMETESEEESASIRLRFLWGTDLNEAANDVRQRLDRIRGRLPDDVEPPVLYKFDFNQTPVFRMGMFSDSMDQAELRYLAEHTIKPRLERRGGVASVTVGGGRVREIQVNLLQEKIDALELSPGNIVAAIRAENINMPAGEIYQASTRLAMRTKGQFVRPEEFGDIVVATRDGVPIYLRDVADVRDGYEELRSIERIDDLPGISLAVYKQSGSNTVAVADDAIDELEAIRADYPFIQFVTLYDSAKFIRNAIDNVRTAALSGAVLAVLILLLFLRDLRATLIIASAIPVSVMASFTLIYFNDFTLNIVSFGGLALGVGLLVDSSIVVLENIFRHREAGEDARTAAIAGTREVSTAIIASTLTTLVVFLPLLFLSGASSIMFTQLAYVVAFSLFCSLMVSLTLIPTLARRLLKVESLDATPDETFFHKMYRLSEYFFAWIEERYRAVLHVALRHRVTVVTVSCALFAASLPIYQLLGFEYMPEADEGEVRVFGRMAPGTRVETMDETFKTLENIVKREVGEHVEHIATRLGSGASFRTSSTNIGSMEIVLKPVEERSMSSDEVADVIRKATSEVPGVRVYARASGGLWIFRMLSPDGEEVRVEIFGYDREEGMKVAEKVRERLETIDGITGAQISRSEPQPEVALEVDRFKAAEAGFTVTDVGQNIRTNFGGEIATRFREGGEEYDVRVRLAETDRQTMKDLSGHWLTNDAGERIPASNFLEPTRTAGPTEIERKNQQRYLTVDADLEPGYALGNVMKDVERELRAIDMPPDFTLNYGGEYEEQQKSFRELVMGIILAIVLVYMVMAAQFESMTQPLIIMFAIPFATIGVLLMLWTTGTTMSVQSMLGIIVLVGIVVNNAIVLVDFINGMRREQGIELHEAVEQGGRRRLRPILMTTLTTTLALVPMAMGLGSGGELQAPMARVVIGGMLTSTLITLVLIPILYTSFEEFLERRRQKKGATEPAIDATPVAK